MALSFSSSDNHLIQVHHWLPEQPPKQVLVISHGMAEHIERYEKFAQVCVAQGIAVYGANHRGHGPDTTHPGHFADHDGWEKLLEDLNLVIEQVTKRHGQAPILLGHSMGSFLARHYAIRYGDKLQGLILSGSNYQGPLLFHLGRVAAYLEGLRIGMDKPSPLLEKLSFGNFNKRFQPQRSDHDWLCRDTVVVDAYIADPLCGFTCTPKFWCDFLGGLVVISQSKALKRIPNTLPIYLFCGSDDPVTRYAVGVIALDKALRKAGQQDVTHQIYPQGRHEMLSETNKEQVHQDLFNWLEHHIP